MTKKVMQKQPCEDCARTCQSILGKHRKIHGDEFQPIRKSYNFANGQNMPFKPNGRKGFYCIQSGYVRLNYKSGRTSKTVRISGPGNIVGLLNSVSDLYTVTALEPVVACYFDLDIFFMLQSRIVNLSKDIIKWLCELLIVRDDLICALENKTAKGRIAALLISLASKFSRKGPDNSLEILPKIDRTTLSELSCTAPETLSRVLTDLEKNKIIEKKGRSIRILDHAALVSIFDND
jgi:CRP/FNR family transcriptional regulator